MQMRRIGAYVAGLVAAGCVEGAGDPCTRHSDCKDGLECVSGACAACEAGVACNPIDLIVKSCDETKSPLKGAQFLKLTITGQKDDGSGEEQLAQQTVAVDANEMVVPEIPLGKGRRLVVEALADADAVVAVARGASARFDVQKSVPTPAIVVYLRPTQQFSPAYAAGDATTCTELIEARAGHSTTLMKDGRVLIAGGYKWDGTKRVYLQTAEIFDPRKGTISPVAEKLKLARAFQTAHGLPDGRVLLVGGLGMINGKEEGLHGETFDPSTGKFSLYQMENPRYRHASAMLPSGYVLVTGGVSAAGGVPMAKSEYFIPNERGDRAFTQAPNMKSPRADHAAAAVGEDGIVIAGGTDGTSALASVEAFKFLSNSPIGVQDTGLPALAIARANPFAVSLLFGDQTGVLVVGATAGTQTKETAFDFLPPAGTSSKPAPVMDVPPSARKDSCAASFVGGATVGAIVAGGRLTAQGDSLTRKVDAYTLDYSSGSGQLRTTATGELSSPRAGMGCATLPDGTVVVTGGELVDGGAKTVSSVIEVYQP